MRHPSGQRGAVMVLVVLLPLLAWADASATRATTTMRYAAPAGENPQPSQVEVTEWPVGTPLCVAVASAAVFEAPRSDKEPRAALRWGSPVVVSQIEKGLVKRGARFDRWYRLREGWVFGSNLSSQCLVQDLDGDGKPETVALAFTDEFQIQVRVSKDQQHLDTLDLRPAGEGYLSLRGGNAQLSFVAAKVAGAPLLQIDSKPNACADFSTTYVSFVGGKLRVALVLNGLADPPSHSIPSVVFDPKRKTATVTVKNSSEDEHGKETVERRKTRYLLENGVFHESPTR